MPRRDSSPGRACAALLAALVALPGSAAADESAPQLRALAEGLVGENKTIAPRPSVAVTAGGVTDLEDGGLAGEVEVGVTWGRYSTGLFSPMHLSRVALAGRISRLDRDTFVASAVAGRTVDDLLGRRALVVRDRAGRGGPQPRPHHRRGRHAPRAVGATCAAA